MIVLSGRAIDLTGQRFGDLTVIEPADTDRHNRIIWRCSCACGAIHLAASGKLRCGDAKSCGCKQGGVIHGHARNKTRGYSRTYQSWRGMRGRCLDPSHKAYKDYGGRGITICDQWRESFEVFLSDMGLRPPSTTLGRIDNERGYGPGNCEWSTAKEQGRNRRSNRILAHQGRSQSVAAWAEECGIPYPTLYSRLRKGWPIERALATPSRRRS